MLKEIAPGLFLIAWCLVFSVVNYFAPELPVVLGELGRLLVRIAISQSLCFIGFTAGYLWVGVSAFYYADSGGPRLKSALLWVGAWPIVLPYYYWLGRVLRF